MADPDWVDWRETVPDLTSERAAYLSSKALFNPRSMTIAEIQELAASVMAHCNRQFGRTEGRLPKLNSD